MSLTLALAGLAWLSGADAASSRLAVIQQAPNFGLTSQAGKPVQLSNFKGKVLLVGFIFTTCSGTCPATTSRMVQIQQELSRRRDLKEGKVHLLSITLDPARDTPEKLSDYLKLYNADPGTWTMLTGT